jgi:DNA-binding XRE family transcriptional regulator
MVPGSTGNQEVKELKEQVGNLQSQLAEALALLKQKTAAKEK